MSSNSCAEALLDDLGSPACILSLTSRIARDVTANAKLPCESYLEMPLPERSIEHFLRRSL